MTDWADTMAAKLFVHVLHNAKSRKARERATANIANELRTIEGQAIGKALVAISHVKSSAIAEDKSERVVGIGEAERAVMGLLTKDGEE